MASLVPASAVGSLGVVGRAQRLDRPGRLVEQDADGFLLVRFLGLGSLLGASGGFDLFATAIGGVVIRLGFSGGRLGSSLFVFAVKDAASAPLALFGALCARDRRFGDFPVPVFVSAEGDAGVAVGLAVGARAGRSSAGRSSFDRGVSSGVGLAFGFPVYGPAGIEPFDGSTSSLAGAVVDEFSDFFERVVHRYHPVEGQLRIESTRGVDPERSKHKRGGRIP